MSVTARAERRASISDLLRGNSRPLFSFELYPPRNEEETQRAWFTVRRLESLAPDFVSVTYGANGSTRDRTITMTKDIAETTTLRTMAHLTAASQSRDQLRRVIGSYAAAGIRHVLAIRGDMPGGPLVPWEQHPEGLANATELVAMIRELGDFCIGVAAFPDLHPQTRDADLDARVLKEKADAGADFALTQLFFTPARYFELVDRVRSIGCDIPIIPGIQPVTRLAQIERFAELSGAELPPPVVARLQAAGDDPKRVRKVGVDIATEQASELLAGGAPGVHLYTMNRSLATREVYARLRPEFDRA
ncbi:methylenetetrahydrofolate reductase [NAD(P)H] [Microlunatus sp. Gsoil 973]|uniref:methylenetetrahydrofolate reductase [NAD(P)H] n=1 Tax=Microlunatus sp. Gsoil 973 TaxID=2672569 RepID=UPI0012B4FB4B|nr:methylenetetrahydrofolate reductase [NAD(P)H] [Microlunatus sp. Gsoil 973]QGN31905.1 methylenetetrahydrofolate reductase [NAD(P)H] [Microlunatus sp. Gsoil 973]